MIARIRICAPEDWADGKIARWTAEAILRDGEPYTYSSGDLAVRVDWAADPDEAASLSQLWWDKLLADMRRTTASLQATADDLRQRREQDEAREAEAREAEGDWLREVLARLGITKG